MNSRPCLFSGAVRRRDLEINMNPRVLSLRRAGGSEISQRWRAGRHGVVFEVKTKLLQGCSSFLLLFLQVPQGASPSASSRGACSPLKTPPSEEISSVTAASSLSPIRPPGAALDGNQAASSLLFPTVKLIHFKLPFFFFFKFRGTNVPLYIQFSGYATCMNQTFNHLPEGLWRWVDFMAGGT